MEAVYLGHTIPSKVKHDRNGRPIVIEEPEKRLHVVGGCDAPMKDSYDPNQYWFSFMDRASFYHIVPIPPKKVERDYMLQVLNKRVREPFVKLEQCHMELYDYESREPQYVLPFLEGKRLSNNQLKKLTRKSKVDGKKTDTLEYAKTWEKDANGGLLKVDVRSNDTREEIIEWCNQNCRMRYFIQGTAHLIFESMFDAIIGKMRFS